MFQIVMEHLPEAEEMQVVRATTAVQNYAFDPVVSGADLIAFQELVRKVPVSETVLRYAVTLVRSSRPDQPAPLDFVRQWVSYGASVRAAQYLVLGGKARALMHGRYHVAIEDVRALALPVLRHRILRNFHAESERVTSDQLIERLLAAVPVPKSGMQG